MGLVKTVPWLSDRNWAFFRLKERKFFVGRTICGVERMVGGVNLSACREVFLLALRVLSLST
jgi:hypothetical protein